MSGDFISLFVLMISAFRLVRDIWRQGAALASVPIEFLETDGSEASAQLAKGATDIVLLDAALADADRGTAINLGRAIKPALLIAIAGCWTTMCPDLTVLRCSRTSSGWRSASRS
jgi:hypothetical protein